jgi:PAS domain S-box-containing protein
MSPFRSLWLWLALRFVLAGMLPLLLVAMILSWVLLPQVLADIETRHQALARAVSGQVEGHLRSAGRELSAVAEYLQHRGDQPAPFRFEPILGAHAGSGEVFAAIYVVDATNTVSALGLPRGELQQRGDGVEIDLSRLTFVREARQRRAPVWSEIFVSVVSSRRVVSLAIPLADQVLIGEVAIDRLSEFLGSLPTEAGMWTMILDHRGQVVARSQASLDSLQTNPGPLPIVSDALQGHFATHDLSMDGEKFIATLVSVPQLGWTVLVAQPRGDALKPFVSTLWALAVAALVALLLATIATLLLARRVAQRIGRYTAQTHAIAEGDYEQRWPVSRIREFDELAADLDRMSLAIRQRERELATSEARYRSVVSNAPVVIFQFDEMGVFHFSEGKGVAGAGFEPGQAVGQSLFSLYGQYPEICAHARRAIGGEALQFVSRIGDTYFDTHFNSVRADDGTVQVIGVALDITERIRAEEALRASEARFRDLSAMASDWFWEQDEQFRFTYFSYGGAMSTLAESGFDHHQMIGKTRWELPVLMTAAEWEAHRAVLDAHQPFRDLEYRISSASGGDRWFNVNGQPLFDAAGGFAGYRGTARDVTGRKQADQALQESEARYRLLFDSNPHPMWVYDLQTLIFLTVNDAAVASYGYSRDEFLSMRITDLGTGEDTPLLVEDIVAVEESSDYSGFWRHRRKDGTTIDVDTISHALSFEGHRAVLVLADDITERRRAEQALLESERKYRELVENANSIILRWTPAGQITFINEFGLKFFGYAEEELLGRHVVGTIVPLTGSNGRDMRPLMETICRNPQTFEHNTNQNMRRDGERVWVSWTNRAVFGANGQVVEVFSVGSDITERKRAEDELQRHREHLEELVSERTSELRQAMAQLVQTEKLAALGNLVAGVAHELNTPLGNSRVVASLLGEQLREFAEAVESGSLRRSQLEGFLNRGREAVDLLERNSARAADLIGHFKQVAVDQSSARRRVFDLRQTVEEMLVTLRPTFKRSQHRIDVDIPVGLLMDSYPGPLEQVIANLIANALTHGLATVEHGCIELHAHTDEDQTQVVLRCADNGVGIAAATAHRIFEPFFTTRLGQGGSGLGLYIVFNLVTSVLGGSIVVDTSPGHGACFTLTLPRVAPNRTTSVP